MYYHKDNNCQTGLFMQEIESVEAKDTIKQSQFQGQDDLKKKEDGGAYSGYFADLKQGSVHTDFIPQRF
jgi:hypothetical protein